MRPRSSIRQAALACFPEGRAEAACTWRDAADALHRQQLLDAAAPSELRLVRKAVRNAVQAGELARVGSRKVAGACKPMATYIRLAAEAQPQRSLGFELSQAWAA